MTRAQHAPAMAALVLAFAFVCTVAAAQPCPGTPEVCNGVDDDCDGEADDGLPMGGPCQMAYDTTSFPSVRLGGECRTGTSACVSGQVICLGGVGPLPELCDGKDNDCDGMADEAGPAPDGLSESLDPLDAKRVLGQPCDTNVGLCQPGVFACINGRVECTGEREPQIEVCDCLDNDCDGQIDEDSDGDGPDLCGSGRVCATAGQYCACSLPCSAGLYPCPSFSTCLPAQVSDTRTAGNFCLPGQEDCRTAGCPPFLDCVQGLCVNDPCLPNPCAEGQVCRPASDAGGPLCVPSCEGEPCLQTDASTGIDASPIVDAAPAMKDATPAKGKDAAAPSFAATDAGAARDAGNLEHAGDSESGDEAGCGCRAAAHAPTTLPWGLVVAIAAAILLAYRRRLPGLPCTHADGLSRRRRPIRALRARCPVSAGRRP